MIYDENGNCTCREAAKVARQIDALVGGYMQPRLASAIMNFRCNQELSAGGPDATE